MNPRKDLIGGHMKLSVKAISIALLLTVASCGGSNQSESLGQGEALTSRLSYIYSPINLLQEDDVIIEDRFEHIATVEAPVSATTGQRLQSTAVALASNSMAIVSYNNVGSDISGAIDLINIEDPERPILVQSMTFEQSEFSDLITYNDFVVAVGVDYNFGAIAKVFEFVEGKLVFKSNYDLEGYYATNIQRVDQNLYVNVGDNFGAIKLQISDTGEITEQISFLSDNSLYISATKDENVLLRSDEENTITLLDSDFELNTTISIENFSKDAPAEIIVNEDSIITNSLDGKILQYSKVDGILINELDIEGTGNGLTVSGKNLFLAQGEEGLHNYELNGDELNYKGKLDFSDDSGSANSVTIHPVSITSQSSYTDIIYQGDGLGGLKIIAYKNPIVIESKLLNKIEASVLNLPVLSIVDELPNILIKDDASNILERIALIDTVKTTYNLLENINVAVDTQLLLEIDTDIISSTGSLSVCVNLDHFLSLGLKSISRKNLITGLVTTIDNLLNLDLCILVTEEITLNF